MPKFLERAIASVAPGLALKRGLSRRKFERLRHSEGGLGFGGSSGYEAGSHGRRTSNWRARRTDANAALDGALQILRARSRDLARNNTYGASGIGTIDDWTVGCGIQAQPVGDTDVAKKAAELWRKWAGSPRCDSEEIGNMAALQSLAMRTCVESGSALVRRRLRFGAAAKDLPLGLQIQILEPDHMDLEKTQGLNGNRVTHGVEFNAYGRREAYWLFPEHPGASHPKANRGVSKRVPASEIAHVFLRTRPGQVQAAPWLTPAIMKMRSLDEYEDSELLRMVIASNWAGFVTTEADPDGDDPQDERIEDVQPGQIEYLRPGETIEFPDVPSVSGRDSYVASQLRAISAGLRVPYEALTGDLTKVNFSSGRMGFNAFDRRVKVWQDRLVVGQMLRPIWGWFVEAAIAASLLPTAAAELEATFTPPGRMILDPDKEGKAEFADVRNGTKTLFEVLRGRGHDPELHLQEAARSFELLDSLGLKLDCDPRHSAAPGAGSAPPEAKKKSKKAAEEDGDDPDEEEDEEETEEEDEDS